MRKKQPTIYIKDTKLYIQNDMNNRTCCQTQEQIYTCAQLNRFDVCIFISPLISDF